MTSSVQDHTTILLWRGKCTFCGQQRGRKLSTMTFTLSPRHFPNRSGWQNGILHRLS
jgi:hypothetical protein